MLAIKENRQYTITEVDVQSFVADGYDVYDDNGDLVAYGVGKTVPFDKYAKLMAQNEKLQDEIIELREQVKTLEKKGAKKG
jgi:cell division protein FtsB